MAAHEGIEAGSETPPQTVITMMASGYMVSQALYVAARLGIADRLTDGPKSVSELATALEADASALYRLLRMLAARGVFREGAHGRFEQSALSACLQSNGPNSLRAPVILWNEEQYMAWGDLLHTVKTGQTAFEHVIGSTWVSHYIHGKPEKARLFNSAMAGWTAQIGRAVARAYDFSSFGTLIDIGGGQGVLLSSILKEFPAVRGIVFDAEGVISGANRHIEAEGLSSRCHAVGGDFFQAVPPGGDAYVLSQVLHDWADEQCISILRNCLRAMSNIAKLLVIETVIRPTEDSAFATLSDLHMMVITGGRERTEAEYSGLLARAGFRLTNVIPTLSPAHVLEAVIGSQSSERLS